MNTVEKFVSPRKLIFLTARNAPLCFCLKHCFGTLPSPIPTLLGFLSLTFFVQHDSPRDQECLLNICLLHQSLRFVVLGSPVLHTKGPTRGRRGCLIRLTLLINP